LRVRKFLKNQFVVQNGDVCDYESFVVHGCLKSFCIDEEGSEQIVSFGLENWWIGDLGSFITRTPAELNVQCLEPSLLVQIHYDALQRLFKEVPSL
jgi:CRP-like cAMP-binding protein